MYSEEFGNITVKTVPCPEVSGEYFGTYTAGGRVLVSYQDMEKKDYYIVKSMNDDGGGVCDVFEGEIPQKKTANGIRWMCFPDNKRILLGDYVIECEPDLDNCKKASLIPVEYPAEIWQIPGLHNHWSEIVIAPDNQGIAWTLLTMGGAAVFVGTLRRDGEKYIIENTCQVSSKASMIPDPDSEGAYLEDVIRGGEVKQFVHGGRSLSLVGACSRVSASVIQALDGGEVYAISDMPGYEETTILSPDEKLGIVMSPRFSERTDGGIFGLIPLPGIMAVKSRITMNLYMYAIAGVRAFREGNIGPALIDIAKAKEQGIHYKGVNLSDPENRYVYTSPMSWKPDSTRAMWNEVLRSPDIPAKRRIRIAILEDREPSEAVPPAKVPSPEEIPYAIPLSEAGIMERLPGNMTVNGRRGGTVVCTAHTEGEMSISKAEYRDYSEDGKTVYNGTVTVSSPAGMFQGGRTVYRADVTTTGELEGRMDFQVTFLREGPVSPAMVSFGETDGEKDTYGYAKCGDMIRRAEDLLP